MPVQLYKPNLDAMHQQAEQARKEEKERRSGDLEFGRIEEGDNILRVLPPTNSRGIIGKKVCTHFFNNAGLGKIVDLEKALCVAGTFSHERPDASCALCDKGDQLLAQYPTLELRKWHRPGTYWYVQAVRRLNNGDVTKAQLFRLTPSLRNWFVTEMESLMMQGVDPTDLQAGLDIKITKTIKKVKGREQTRYEKTLWGIHGPSPLHKDPSIVQAVVASMVDPDGIWKYPDDATLAEISQAAASIHSFYVKQQYAGQGVSPANLPGVAASTIEQAVQVAVSPQPSPPPPQPAQPAQVIAPQPSAQPAQPPQTTAAAPTDRPPCFGGAAPRSTHPQYRPEMDDGGSGFNDDSELCLTCTYELSCMDACNS